MSNGERMHEKTIQVRDGMFRVRVQEAGAGQDVVFIPGMDARSWIPLLEQLAQRYHVRLPEHPGVGESTGDEHLLDHHDLFYYYLDLFDAMGLQNAALIGHSIGGWIAAELAAIQPDRFSKLVLVNPVGLWNSDYPLPDFFVMTPDELLQHTFHDTKHPTAQAMGMKPTDAEALKRATIAETKARIFAAKYLWPIPDKGLKNRAHRISAPTLICWGKSDGLVPVAYADDFKALIKQSSVTIFDNSGHLPHVEQPDQLVNALTGFLG